MLDKGNLEYIRRRVLTHFKCQGSGNCCRCPGVVMVNSKTIQEMAYLKKMAVVEFRRLYVFKERGWDVIASKTFRPNCFLDDNNKCSVYVARPQSCRSYPNWDIVWASKKSINKERLSCPGLKVAFEALKIKL